LCGAGDDGGEIDCGEPQVLAKESAGDLSAAGATAQP
jgi:hypothetical protein